MDQLYKDNSMKIFSTIRIKASITIISLIGFLSACSEMSDYFNEDRNASYDYNYKADYPKSEVSDSTKPAVKSTAAKPKEVTGTQAVTVQPATPVSSPQHTGVPLNAPA